MPPAQTHRWHSNELPRTPPSIAEPVVVSSSGDSFQVNLRHTALSAKCCFRQDLTWFTASDCTGPGDQHSFMSPVPQSLASGREFDPAIADCRHRAPLPPRLARQTVCVGIIVSYSIRLSKPMHEKDFSARFKAVSRRFAKQRTRRLDMEHPFDYKNRPPDTTDGQSYLCKY